MRKLLIGFMLMAVSASTGLAQTDFYTNVTNLWYQGGEYRTNVLTIANARLASNTNDIAGLLLKANYHVEFAEVGMISNAFLRVIQVGDTITTTHFAQCWQEESKPSILWFLDIFAKTTITPQDIQEGKDKSLLPGKQLIHAELIEALQKDGYFD